MQSYTVEVTTEPVVDDRWEPLRQAIDAVPGTVLLEDPDEPILMVPVDALTPLRAAQFVDGLAKLLDIHIRTGSIYPTPDLDADLDEDSESEDRVTLVVQQLDAWMRQSDETMPRGCPA